MEISPELTRSSKELERVLLPLTPCSCTMCQEKKDLYKKITDKFEADELKLNTIQEELSDTYNFLQELVFTLGVSSHIIVREILDEIEGWLQYKKNALPQVPFDRPDLGDIKKRKHLNETLVVGTMDALRYKFEESQTDISTLLNYISDLERSLIREGMRNLGRTKTSKMGPEETVGSE